MSIPSQSGQVKNYATSFPPAAPLIQFNGANCRCFLSHLTELLWGCRRRRQQRRRTAMTIERLKLENKAWQFEHGEHLFYCQPILVSK